jgi:hypothetical protein
MIDLRNSTQLTPVAAGRIKGVRWPMPSTEVLRG